MIKKIVLGALSIVIGLVTLLALSPGSTRWIVNQYLATDDLTLECLDYSVTSLTHIEIAETCITSTSFEVTMQSATFDLSKDELAVDNLSIQLIETDSEDSDAQFSLPSLSIPGYLPTITIDSISIHSANMSEPIIFNLTQTSANSFAISHGWDALVSIEDTAIDIQLDWTLESLRAFLPANLVPMIGQQHWDSPIRSSLSLNKNKLTSSHIFTLDFIHQTAACNLDLTMGGSALVDADLTSQQAIINLSQLAILVNLQNCQQLQDIPNELLPGTITIAMPDKILFDQEKMSTSQINVGLVEPFTTKLTLSDVSLLTSGSFKSLLNASIFDDESASFHTSGEIAINDGKPNVNLPHSELRITNLNYNNVGFKNIAANFSIFYDDRLTLEGNGSVDEVNTESVSLNGLKSTFSAKGSDINNLDILLNTELLKGKSAGFVLAKLQQDFQFKLAELNDLTGHGKTLITGLNATSITLTDLSIDHSLNGNISDKLLSSVHTATVNDGLSMIAKQSQETLELTIAPQPITSLNPTVQQLFPDVSFYDGEISAQLDYNLLQNAGKGQFSMDKLSLLRSDMIITGISMNAPFEIDSAGLQLDNSKLTIDELYNGVKLNNISANIAAANSMFSANNVSAGLFEGDLSVERVWLDARDQKIEVIVKDINLQKVLNLQEKAGINAGGIEISGLISGRLPLTIKDLQPSISNAMLNNSGLGTLKINGNEAFQALKQQSPEIGKDLALLENFNFDSLESSLNMTTTGQTYLDIALKGKNPEKNQALNFNYTHDQDMFTLFKALRIADDFKEKIEKRLSKVH